MAKRTKKPCRKIGCAKLVEYPNKYCEVHLDLEEKDKAERNYLYDTTVRHGKDKKYTAFYKSKEWNKVRQMALIRDNGLCQVCLREKKITMADIVHHKIEIKEDWSKRLDLNNLECVCLVCHNRLHPPG